MQKIGDETAQAASLYIHVPFCSHKCPYCHFYVVPYRKEFEEKLLVGLEREWQWRSPLLLNHDIVSIYFGGGTPSLLQPSSIERLLQHIGAKPQEITLEVNPETVTLDTMIAFKHAGINRLSLGIQSLDDSELTLLDRRHNAKQAIQAIHTCAAAGFNNLSIDLMFELPGQTLSSWKRTLDHIADLPVTHLSLYNLTFELHTPFFKRKKELMALLPDEETRLMMLNTAVNTLESAGLHRYEISAFSKPGFHSVHNSGYWLARPFLGLGPSAYSHWEGKRFQNACSMHHWAQALESNKSPVDFEEKLSREAAFNELLAIQLRLLQGVHLENFCVQHGPIPETTQQALCSLIQKGWLLQHDHYLLLTEEGKLFYDSVATEII
ncbi:MAG: radical SAM family heme chaperone HemW [Simkania sp.]|nr:radical SAM family heme chaperone HemW [Simkania sp.]